MADPALAIPLEEPVVTVAPPANNNNSVAPRPLTSFVAVGILPCGIMSLADRGVTLNYEVVLNEQGHRKVEYCNHSGLVKFPNGEIAIVRQFDFARHSILYVPAISIPPHTLSIVNEDTSLPRMDFLKSAHETLGLGPATSHQLLTEWEAVGYRVRNIDLDKNTPHKLNKIDIEYKSSPPLPLSEQQLENHRVGLKDWHPPIGMCEAVPG